MLKRVLERLTSSIVDMWIFSRIVQIVLLILALDILRLNTTGTRGIIRFSRKLIFSSEGDALEIGNVRLRFGVDGDSIIAYVSDYV